MKANEVRIGNLVFKRGASDTIVIDAHNIGQLQRWEITKYAETPPFEPIPITEEWLFRMGFEKSMMWTWFIDIKGNTKLVYYVGTRSWSLNFRNDGEFTCKHVHQLQNLYFALTGEELTIKEQ